MTKQLVVYFCGTGASARSFYEFNDYLKSDNIITIVVNGCESPNVCDTSIFPDLKGFARRFVEKLFVKKGKELQIPKGAKATTPAPRITAELESIVGINFTNSSQNLADQDEVIGRILLCGFSRGAVTCFEVAKVLNRIAPEIPVDIVADQPVPGNMYPFPGSNAISIADCSDLKNLKNVTIILGAYTGKIHPSHDSDLKTKNTFWNRFIKFFHYGFFSQIVPKLPFNAHRDLIIIPRTSHHHVPKNSPTGPQHMHMQIAKYLNAADKTLVSDEAVASEREKAHRKYTASEDFTPALFPKQNQLQRIFGLSPKQIYHYVDELHPTPGLRHGYQLEQDETLIAWWNKHDKQASLFSTQLTKNLVSVIETTDINDVDSLKMLFSHADKWLLLKADTASSRYFQVESLRNNIQQRLIDKGVDEAELRSMQYQNLKDTNYFLKHWTTVSTNASYFKTDATRQLTLAFKAHAEAEQSLENDNVLLKALDTWLINKQGSKSKRMEDVIEIREHLTSVIKMSKPAQQPSLNTAKMN